jgi:hypothetical protein
VDASGTGALVFRHKNSYPGECIYEECDDAEVRMVDHAGVNVFYLLSCKCVDNPENDAERLGEL